MGCTLTTSEIDVDPEKKLISFLTAEEINIVQSSWVIISQDIDSTGLLIFQKLFVREKHLSRLFHNLMTRESSGEYVFDETKLVAHGRIVLEALGSAVECLDDCTHLTQILIAMGERHALYSVEPKMVKLLWPPVADALEEKLGSNFTPEVSRAWEHVFEYLGSKMIQGIMKWQKAKV